MVRNRVAFDCETFPICKEAVFPQVVCVTMALVNDEGMLERHIWTDAQVETEDVIRMMLEDPDLELIGCNTKYDLACIKNTWPALTPLIWDALAAGRVTDVVVRERLLNLTSHGMLDMQPLPDGSAEKLKYSLKDLVMKYLGLDISKEKDDENSWRLRFNELSGMMPEDYPAEVKEYALEDAELTLMVATEQDGIERNPDGGPLSMYTQYFQTACDYGLGMFTEQGFHIDYKEVAKVETMLNEKLAPDKMKLLIKSGVLRPAVLPRPHKNKAKNKDGTPKMTQGKDESINKAVLMEIINLTCEDNDLEVKHTDPTPKHPEGQTATSTDVILVVAPLNPILQEYQNRQKVMKLKTSYLPNLKEGIVYANYDVLKETGRTSSYGGKLYPSWNGQQVDPRVRRCCIPRDGHILVSADFHAIELVSLGQKIYDLFGHSTLRDLIHQEVDPHAYLGAQLAYHLDTDIGFQEAVQAEISEPNAMQIYNCFLECKTADLEKLQDFYKHYRKLAKPVGLGYPGGLGPQTCMEIAKDQYEVEGDIELFTMLREIWHDTFPEMKPYFKWITERCTDPADPDLYCYLSPLDMYRAGATYCAAANGAALQTPTAEGAKGGVFDVARACSDPSEQSILLGCRPLLFIHDEQIIEIPEDDHIEERAQEIRRLMEEAMQAIMPDMPIKVEPCLMRAWDKKAEAVYNEDGSLLIWEPDNESDSNS